MVRIEKVLCPIDFSEYSHHAFDRAVAIARSHHAAVTALYVDSLPPTSALSYVGPEGLAPFSKPEVDRDRVAAEMRRFLARDGSIGVQVACEVTEAPDISREILAQADRLPADLIVMGTHGRSGFQRLLLGSVTEKVVRTARRPVLTVPGALPDVVPAGPTEFRRILCALDFSDCSIEALRYAASLSELTDASLTALHVIELTPPVYDPLFPPPLDLSGYQLAFETASRDRLRRTLQEAVPKTCRVEEIVTTGKPYREILRVAAEQHSDLIVLGIHGRNPIERMLFGSTTEHVVRRAPCAVLTVRPETRAAAAAA